MGFILNDIWKAYKDSKAKNYESELVEIEKERRQNLQTGHAGVVKSLKTQIATLQGLLDDKDQMIQDLRSEKGIKEETVEEKLINGLMAAFVPQQAPQPQKPLNNHVPDPKPVTGTSLESGTKYEDQEIREVLKKVPKTHLKMMAAADFSTFAKICKQNVPDMAHESIVDAHKIAKEMI